MWLLDLPLTTILVSLIFLSQWYHHSSSHWGYKPEIYFPLIFILLSLKCFLKPFLPSLLANQLLILKSHLRYHFLQKEKPSLTTLLPNPTSIKSYVSLSNIVFIFTLCCNISILYYNCLFCLDLLQDYVLFKHRDYLLVQCSISSYIIDEKIICSVLLKSVLFVPLFLS